MSLKPRTSYGSYRLLQRHFNIVCTNSHKESLLSHAAVVALSIKGFSESTTIDEFCRLIERRLVVGTKLLSVSSSRALLVMIALTDYKTMLAYRRQADTERNIVSNIETEFPPEIIEKVVNKVRTVLLETATKGIN